MVNYIWAVMITGGIAYGCFNGEIMHISDCILDSSKEAVQLCIVMMGIIGLWSGVMNTAAAIGLVEKLKKWMEPLIHFLFPRLQSAKAKEYISTNIVANLLGLGWAATPSGLMAMKEMQKENKKQCRATNEMCTFLIINISSLQLIPMMIISYRSQYGSQNPTAVIVPGLIATGISTVSAVVFCKWKDREK